MYIWHIYTEYKAKKALCGEIVTSGSITADGFLPVDRFMPLSLDEPMPKFINCDECRKKFIKRHIGDNLFEEK